ncbi:MAG TPA: CADD family putative folate metabolism protein [Candidatus Binataceae bacterium]|nr:CADD family putative folate metabolism protein [Candidatus Binataceae bacterium]
MPNGVIATIDSMISERSLLKHPFYQAWTCGTLPIERLRGYAVRYFPHVAAFPRYLSAVHSRCTDIATRQALLENLIEEERGAENHPELWLRFAEALGVPRGEVTESAPVPAAENLVNTFLDLAGNGQVQCGMAALYAYESQIPPVATAKIDGLKRFYGITDARGLAFFSVHEKADVWHAQADAELIERSCQTEAEANAAIKAADRALNALWSMLDAV